MRNIQKQSKTKKIIISAILIVALLAAGIYFWQRQNDDATLAPSGDSSTIKYAPATEEEKQESESRKDRLVKDAADAEQEKANLPANGKKPVNPIITTAQYTGDSASVQAYVPGIFEEGGTCTATLKNGTATFTKQSPAFANATTTDCQHINIPRAEFPGAGTWTVTVSYSSDKAEGTSTQQQPVEVK